MNQEEIELMAEKHGEWYARHFAKIVKIVYRDAFIHGFKHGKRGK